MDSVAQPNSPRGSRKRLGPSIGDVARLAGVSSQTVSRVSTGAERVRPETRERVLSAMEQLGYSPNHAARALRYGRFGSIGVIAHHLSRTGEFHTIDALVEAARKNGFTVNLIDVESPSSDDMSVAVQRLTHQSIDGLVIIRAETATPDTLQLPRRLPIVVSDSRFIGHHPAVSTDQWAGIAHAVRHLLGLGHTTVHHLAGPVDSSPAGVRIQAWRDTLTAHDRMIPDVVRGDWSAASGHAVGTRLLADPSVTAVLCGNDEMAAGLMRAAHERGLRVPEDVSIIGFDDIPLASYLWPPLTTVRQDFSAVGTTLMDVLFQQIRSGQPLTDHRTTIPTELIVRGSTAPPRP
ncbi:LacI family DNA-binding transcriptional regulator [Jonesia denitrificans]|uniref:Transcriptional regulator, LacI family n=1 Tax=Jonesia denitrificans (strain ATCC 14870 / DSM 20603 / BCRC 15368 / CIP 55.134 / JCM 11481 / NBRC 15587 / NCTC 10816 / Prevot 55134) TaxID=471856 RepID=C7R598_JONDD|nr:LacI family DNA-binding transcriptional regulator [Jonesia denitrificans]ACV07776.1 transcriptional regulator, LacI family [Jonesia denitrificans DSM 20603]ASE08505.1 LacI family transcriptional regulator [Jonesia denitrificans]QXB43114.1 LacI family DNA-binding transcriptional regulator [Jonesia denitrificans]SQH19748.1 Lactose operon repressor [Jonesia denitrificans]